MMYYVELHEYTTFDFTMGRFYPIDVGMILDDAGDSLPVSAWEDETGYIVEIGK